ncbi:uncharacterized protein LOC126567652 [Anopheles maculipalpis]|uniref:uncharacterized protein LOC126567652 n=1 Tax=Anopheles maculipalpis TaxID=1496333 RepID=UPI002159B3A5|nr:uncharacterized protein LOC126567652 [Anopheles maculipalpis]
MKLVLVVLSTVIVISAGLSLKPSPRRDIVLPRHMELPDPDSDKDTQAFRSGEQRHETTTPPVESKPAKLRVSGTRRKKVKQVSTKEDESTRVTSKRVSERKLHTKIVHVPEPFVVHVEKPYPVYIEKPVIVEKHLPIHLYITKKEIKHH